MVSSVAGERKGWYYLLIWVSLGNNWGNEAVFHGCLHSTACRERQKSGRAEGCSEVQRRRLMSDGSDPRSVCVCVLPRPQHYLSDWHQSLQHDTDARKLTDTLNWGTQGLWIVNRGWLRLTNTEALTKQSSQSARSTMIQQKNTHGLMRWWAGAELGSHWIALRKQFRHKRWVVPKITELERKHN